MHINGYEFLEVTPSRLINTDKAELVAVQGDDRGWTVSLNRVVVAYHGRFGDACTAAAALVDSLPEPPDVVEEEEDEEAVVDTSHIVEYRNRCLGRISGESWGSRGDY